MLVPALIIGWLAAATAPAGTIGIRGNTLVIGAEGPDGYVNLIGSNSATEFMLDVIGPEFVIVTPGCSGGPTAIAGLSAFSCPLSGFTMLEIIGGNEDDVLEFSALSIGATLAGGNGDDVLIGGSGAGTIFGGPGDDLLLDANVPGSNLLFGGPGDDTVPFGVDLGDSDPVFAPLPRAPVSVPTPGSLLLLLAGLGAVVMSKRM